MSGKEEDKEKFFEQDSEDEEDSTPNEAVEEEEEEDNDGSEQEEEEEDEDESEDEKEEEEEDEEEGGDEDEGDEEDDEPEDEASEGEAEEEEESEEKPKGGREGGWFDGDRTVFVGHLWRGFDEGQIRSLFSGSGAVTKVRIPVHKDNGKPKGVAFVEFAAPEHARRALRLDGRPCQGSEIRVKMAESHAAATKESKNAPWRRKAGMAAVDDDYTVYIGNLSLATDEKTLIKELGRFGRIKRVNIPLWHDSGRKRGFALVEFAARSAALAAAEKINGKIIDGREVKASMYKPVDPSVFDKKKNGKKNGGGRKSKKVREREKQLEEDKNYAPQAKKPKKE